MVRTVTADELLLLPGDGCRHELVAGRLVRMSPAGARHGAVAAALAELLRGHVRRHRLGTVFGAETGFLLARNPDTVLAPDAAFVARERLDPRQLPDGFVPFAPDLAVEVQSPGETRRALARKAARWLAAGSRVCWLVEPRLLQVAVHTPATERLIAADGGLDGGSVLPGLHLPVRSIFGPDA